MNQTFIFCGLRTEYYVRRDLRQAAFPVTYFRRLGNVRALTMSSNDHVVTVTLKYHLT
jgi:hypothetical protein